MTQHPSLRSSEKSKGHRSVLKRFERLKHMLEKGEWGEGRSIFGLPKIKILKLKIKKEKSAPEEEGAAEAGAAGTAPAKEGAGKETPGKKDEKGAKAAKGAGAKEEKKK